MPSFLKAMAMRKILLTLILALATPQIAHAWWNGEWTERKKITLDTSATGLVLKQELVAPVVLVRLHTGNFAFDSAKVDGTDLRFLAEDDKTPLKYHIEKFDGLAQIALVWVQVPKLQAGSKEHHIWLYYGNENAVAAEDAKGSFDSNQISVLHFAEVQGSPKDATVYGNHAAQFDGSHVPGGLIGYAQVADGLLQFGAFVEKASDNGLTPLMSASLLNNVPVIQVLLRYGATVDLKNNAGRTALSYAAEGGSEQVIELLLERGANVNAADKKFNTPLFWAAFRDRRGAIRLLLRKGAEQGAVSLDLL